MAEILMLIVLVVIVVFFLNRKRERKINEFRKIAPSFISYCESNRMELVAETEDAIMYRKPVVYEKLKAAYLKEYGKELELKSDVPLYHYIALSFTKKNKQDTNPVYSFTNNLSVPEYKPNLYSNKTRIMLWEDSESFYHSTVERGYSGLAISLESDLERGRKGEKGWYRDVLKEEEMKQWREQSVSSEVPREFKNIINEFLIPYRISIKKFMVNKEAAYAPNSYLKFTNNPLFSESLKTILENSNLHSKSYPAWFYHGFPDVVIWAKSSEGKIRLENKIQTPSDERTDPNGQFNHFYLKQIIDSYLSTSFFAKLELTLDKEEY